MRKNIGPTKYQQENILDPRNTREKNFWTHKDTTARWHETHETHDGTRPTEFSTFGKYQVFYAILLSQNGSYPTCYKATKKMILDNIHAFCHKI